MTVSRHPFSLSYRSNIFPIIRPTVVRISRAGAGVFPARSIRPCTVEDESASSCPARTTWPIPGNGMKMKRSTAAGRSSCATTGAPARATRGSRETGSDEPARLALHRKSYYTLSDYPKGAQGMRESSCCFWSSSLFPRLLIDELAAPHLRCIWSTARRCVQYRKRHAMRDSTDGCASHAVREARTCRRESRFLFQECIAVIVGGLRRSLNAAKRCWKRRTNAARRASCKGAANGCFIVEKCAVEFSGRRALRPLQTACGGPFGSILAPEKSGTESRGTGSAGQSRRTSARQRTCAPATAQRN